MYFPFSKISWNTKLVDSEKNVESKDKERMSKAAMSAPSIDFGLALDESKLIS